MMCTRIIMSVFVGLALFASSSSFAQDPSTSLKVGDKAADFELKTFNDKTVKLSDRFGEDGKHVILLFSRANW